jgi:hypothetical protein
MPTNTMIIPFLFFFLTLSVASCCASIQLVPYDSVNRNKVSIRQLPLFYFPSFTTCFGPYRPSSGEIYNHLIVHLTWGWPVGAETCSEWRKIKKGELTYWNFDVIDGIIRNQLNINVSLPFKGTFSSQWNRNCRGMSRSRNQTSRLGLNILPLCLEAGLISGLEESLFRCSWRSEGSSCSLSVSTDAERDADMCAAVLPPTHLSFQVSNLMIWNSTHRVTSPSLLLQRATHASDKHLLWCDVFLHAATFRVVTTSTANGYINMHKACFPSGKNI